MKRIKQQYHLEPDRGLLNDPNGLVYYKGKYHVYFQWNRFAKNHSYKEWGLFRSKDLVNWDFEGSAMLPDQTFDQCGVYSGSALEINGELYLFYTGNGKEDNKRKSKQCLAISKDGRQILKKGIIIHTPEEYTEHFRDPKVFKGKDNSFFMVVGGQQKNGKGAIALCRSKDGQNWRYTNILAKTKQYEMIECPDLFELDGNHVLLMNPQKRNNEEDIPEYSFSAYKITTFDENFGMLEDEDLDQHRLVDYGFDFYAPQTFKTDDGRRLMLGWMSRMEEEQEVVFSQNESNIHCLTMPRELHVRDGKLYQSPAKELYGMLDGMIPIKVLAEGKLNVIPSRRTFFMQVQNLDIEKKLCINFHEGEAFIQYDGEVGKISFSRKNWLDNTIETRECNVEKLYKIEIWSDYSSMELFINDGEAVFSSRIYPSDTEPNIQIIGSIGHEHIKIHEINTKAVKR